MAEAFGREDRPNGIDVGPLPLFCTLEIPELGLEGSPMLHQFLHSRSINRLSVHAKCLRRCLVLPLECLDEEAVLCEHKLKGGL